MQDMNSAPEVSWREFAYGLALVALIGIVGWALLEQSPVASLALSSRYPMDYVEGLSLDRTLQSSVLQRLYPTSFDSAPYRLTLQPPFFYLFQNALFQISGPALATGRTISQISLIAAALFTAITLLKLTRDISSMVAAPLMLLAYPQISTWSLLNAPETLAFALALGGLCAAVLTPERGRAAFPALAVAALAFLASAATDPMYMIPPLVAAAVHLRRIRGMRAALVFAGIVLAGCVLLFVALNTATQGGFAFNLINGAGAYTKTRTLIYMLNILLRSGLVLVALVIFFVSEPLGGERHRAAPMALAYLLSAVLLAFLSSREGSNMGVMFGVAGAVSFAVGAMLGWLGRNRWIKAGLLVVVMLQVNTLIDWRDIEFRPNIIRRVENRREYPALIKRLEAVDYNVLTDEYIGLQVLGGKSPALYPSEFLQLQMRGEWSEQALIDAIKRKEFALVLLYEPPDPMGEPFIARRWPPAVRQAIYDNYDSDGFVADALAYVPK